MDRWSAALWATVALASGAACSASGSPARPGEPAGGAGGSPAVDGSVEAGADSGIDAPWSGPTITVIGPGADQSSAGKFAGPSDASSKPQLVYPDSGILVPPNMNSIEFHFVPAAGQTLFRFTFTAPDLRFVEYVGCKPLSNGCVFSPDQQFWTRLAQAARGTPPVTYNVSGVNGSSPGAVGTSETHNLAFTNEDINGGLYYWNTGGVIQRYDFGYPLKAGEQFMTPGQYGALPPPYSAFPPVCVGCHALSRDGKKMLVGAFEPAPAPYKVFDVATRTVLQAGGQDLTGASNFSTFSPDGTQLLYSSGSKIGWRDLTTGRILNDSLVQPGTMPDWSPDGSLMVYAKPPPLLPNLPPPPTPGINSASIELLHYDAARKLWNSPRTLVPFQGQNNYYPAFAPSQNWIVFNRSPANNSSYANATVDSQGNANPDGQLWAVPTAGGTPIQLLKATGKNPASWPKWAPGIFSYYGGTVMWLTYSSCRAYGLRLQYGQQTQLWMTAFDPKKAQRGQDPSFPSFWLPFQDISGGNEIAQWVTQVVRKPCTSASDCDGNYICDNGRCFPAVH